MSAAGAAPPAPESAALPRRLAATAYEALLLTALLFATAFLLLPLVGPAHIDPAEPYPVPPPSARALSAFVYFAVCAAYCIGLWGGGRRSLPMKTWRIVLRTTAGAPVGLRIATVRYLAWWIGPALALAAYLALRPTGHERWAPLLLGFNYLWACVDPDRQWLHDRIAGTRLLDEPDRLP